MPNPSSFRAVIDASLVEFGSRAAEVDLAEDVSAWREILREIATSVGRNLPLDQFLQELQLRSKEPTPKADTVRLMTIHSSKALSSILYFFWASLKMFFHRFKVFRRATRAPRWKKSEETVS